jgi:hypothetical protein
VIRFLTVHRGDRWVDVQLGYLQRHLREPYEVWASVEEVPDHLAARFDHAIPMQGAHAGKLNLLWRLVDEQAPDEDILVFLDSDTLPIADPMPLIREALEHHALVAVKRVEDGGDPQPHPCFAAATACAWRAVKCDWSDGHLWRASSGGLTTDVGSNLLYHLDRHEIPWLPLYRVNTVDLHPVWFGVYGCVVYHHGAGSRRYPLSRPETIALPWHTSGSALVDFLLNVPVALRRRLRMRRNRRLSAEMFERLQADPEFWRMFVPDDDRATSSSCEQPEFVSQSRQA